MNRLGQFVKTTLIGGVFVVFPLLLFVLLVDEMLGLIITLATPIADLFPKGMFDQIKTPVLIAVLLIVMASFCFGLAARMVFLKRLGFWFERKVLGRLPIYDAIKRLSLGLLGGRQADFFLPAVMTSNENEREIVYLVEDHEDGDVTVLVPWAPASFAGSVKIVPRSRLELLDASLGDASRALSHWGVGVRKVLGKKTIDKLSSTPEQENRCD